MKLRLLTDTLSYRYLGVPATHVQADVCSPDAYHIQIPLPDSDCDMLSSASEPAQATSKLRVDAYGNCFDGRD